MKCPNLTAPPCPMHAISNHFDPSTMLIRVNDVCNMTSLSRSGVYKRMKEDSTFPRPVSLTDSAARGWVLGEVQMWVRSRVERRTTSNIEG